MGTVFRTKCLEAEGHHDCSHHQKPPERHGHCPNTALSPATWLLRLGPWAFRRSTHFAFIWPPVGHSCSRTQVQSHGAPAEGMSPERGRVSSRPACALSFPTIPEPLWLPAPQGGPLSPQQPQLCTRLMWKITSHAGLFTPASTH